MEEAFEAEDDTFFENTTKEVELSVEGLEASLDQRDSVRKEKRKKRAEAMRALGALGKLYNIIANSRSSAERATKEAVRSMMDQ